ncbi:MAG: DUF1365 domain-containing protein [Pseudomonadota bacterium]
MKADAALRILSGRTVHARFTPFEQRFSYGLMMVDVDVDRLESASQQSRFFSIDRPNLYSLKTSEHGAKQGTDLRPWAARMLSRADIDTAQCTLRLMTFPRHVFYRFAPLSIWFATDAKGALRGVIYEVNNTFGESHTYVARVSGSAGVNEAEKRFHVSPFFDVTGKYRFTLKKSMDGMSLVIDTLVNGTRTHMATISASSEIATDAAFAKAAIRKPLSSIGVTAGIHWEALKIWLKGAGYRSKPNKPEIGHTIARPEKS